MVDRSGATTEINDGALYSPDASGAFHVPESIVERCRKAGLVAAPLSQEERVANVLTAIDALLQGPLKIALNEAGPVMSYELRIRCTFGFCNS